MHLVKLDRRYGGYDRYTHRVEFYGSQATRIKQWIKSRNFLWQQFGPSAELGLVGYYDEQPLWAWDSEKSSIYLKGDALSLFLLKWEAWKTNP